MASVYGTWRNLRFVRVLDRIKTVSSRMVAQSGGSRYFIEQPPLASYDEPTGGCVPGELAVATDPA